MKSQLKIMSYKGPAPGMVHMGLQKEASKSFTNTFSSRMRKAGPVVEDPPGSSSRSHKVLKKSPPTQNNAPTQRLDVYVFGTNCYGELGLGDLTKKSEIPRPVLNSKLPADTLGVSHLVIGGVHSAALTPDGKFLTWGVNDEDALGRDTLEERKDAEMNCESEDEDDEVVLNLKEATPLPVDSSHFATGTVITQLEATDSATFALTSEGLVYRWGIFRVRSACSLTIYLDIAY